MTGDSERCLMRVHIAKALIRGFATGLLATLKAATGRFDSESSAARIGAASGPAGGTTSTTFRKPLPLKSSKIQSRTVARMMGKQG